MAAVLTPRRRRFRWRSIVEPYLFLLPCLVLFGVFRFYPLIYGFYLSLTNARFGRKKFAWVGLSNYEKIWNNERFRETLWRTALYTIESAIPILVIPLLLAVLLAKASRMNTLLRSVVFFPFLLSVVTVGLAWRMLADPVSGPVNYYLGKLSLPTPSWLGESPYVTWTVIASTAWWVCGFYLVIYLAALQDIPREFYDAAAVDGASKLRSFFGITLPLLKPIFVLVAILHIIGSFQIFGNVWVLTRGGPGDETRYVVQHIYETGFQGQFLMGMASAMSWVLFVIIGLVSVVQFRLFRGQTEY